MVPQSDNIQCNQHSSSQNNQAVEEENQGEEIATGLHENQGEHHDNMYEHILDKQEGSKRWRLKSAKSHLLDHSFHKKYSSYSGIPKHLMRYYFQLLKRNNNRNHYSSRSRPSRYQHDF